MFLKLVEVGNLRKAADARAYLFASVRNAILNDTKARQRNVPIDLEQIWFEAPNRDYAAERNLRHALRALPGDQREVIVLHIWGEFTFSQIAEVLNISANTVASRYRYGVAKLREVMSVKEGLNVNS